MKIAVVGATGLVGSKMLRLMEEYGLTDIELLPAASARSVGKEVEFAGKKHKVVSVPDAIAAAPDYAIFSAGGSTSLKYAPLFAKKGCTVVDNSSAWRMYDNVPLVVPEINIDAVKDIDRIIANPNCSTIQMVMALAPIHKAFGIKRLVISTYQSVSGSGMKGLQQMENEEKGLESPVMAYNYPIHHNVIPHGGDFDDHGYTTEETKLVNETRKILRDPNIKITATVVRVPVSGGHSEAVNVETEKPFELEEVRRLLSQMPGVIVVDDPSRNLYPMPLYAYDKNEVFVGRIRRDNSVENGMNLWIVSDNIRKGAATNAVQIVCKLIERRK
ncbi:MAG: aspartate-semialdehyde dehydrogenase [Bacteroides sp.]|nr:aspartate-semialdehyde dehydrogenase [Bacteroides sp.]